MSSSSTVTYTYVYYDSQPWRFQWVFDDELEPLLDDASPTALSLGYIADSNLEEDPDKGPEEDPTDRRDNDDNDDDDDDDDDNDDEDGEEDKEEEERLALADSSAVHVDDHVFSAKDTEVFETDKSAPTPPVPSPIPHRARISIRPHTPMSAATEALIAAVAVALPSSPPPSLLTPLSSPLPHIPSTPLLVSSPLLPLPSPPTHTSLTYAKAPIGYRAAMIRSGAALPSTHHLSEIPSPPILLPFTTHRDDIPEADMPFRKIACFTAPTGRFEVGRVQQQLLLDNLDWILLLWMPPLDVLYLESEARHAQHAWSHVMDCNKEVHAELLAYRAQVQTHKIHIQTRDARIRLLETLVATLMAQTSSL
ncbi:hypothetical protein Tco_1395729 [Tanacetum coccineum]